MDAITLTFVGTWTAIFAGCALVAYCCQQLENYIKKCITKHDE